MFTLQFRVCVFDCFCSIVFCLNKTIRETVERNYIHVSHYFFVKFQTILDAN